MHLRTLAISFLPALAFARPSAPSTNATRNDGIHLAVGPTCGRATGNATDLNAGLPPLSHFKTVVAFGDSYTTGGISNGSALLPPVLTGDSPKAGGRTTNGATWVEDIANDYGMTLMDYAIGGAVVNVTLWPSKANASDFVSQVKLFLTQNHHLDPETTLYTSFFGINDWSASKNDGDHLPQAAADYLAQIKLLTSAPTRAKYVLALDDYGRGSSSATGDAYKQAVFSGLHSLVRPGGLAGYAFADLKYIWNGVLGAAPGYAAFGYTSDGACVANSSSIAGECADPAHTFYWIPGHPSKETHRIMADYVEEVVQKC